MEYAYAPPVFCYLLFLFTPSEGTGNCPADDTIHQQHHPSTPSKGVIRMFSAIPSPQDAFRRFRSRSTFHSFQRSAAFLHFPNSFRRSNPYVFRHTPATRRISTFPQPADFSLLPKECRIPAFSQLLPKESDPVPRQTGPKPLQRHPQAPFHLTDCHAPILKQLSGNLQLFGCRKTGITFFMVLRHKLTVYNIAQVYIFNPLILYPSWVLP